MRTWFHYRTPLQLGLLLVSGWTILSILFVVLILAFTPASTSIGGLFIPTVYRLDNGAPLTGLRICGFLRLYVAT